MLRSVLQFHFAHVAMCIFHSSHARRGVRQRHRDHSENVLEAIAVSDQAARSQGFSGAAPDPGGAQATDAGLFSNHVVVKSRYRRAPGKATFPLPRCATSPSRLSAVSLSQLNYRFANCCGERRAADVKRNLTPSLSLLRTDP